jgi:hypothetical protein
MPQNLLLQELHVMIITEESEFKQMSTGFYQDIDYVHSFIINIFFK